MGVGLVSQHFPGIQALRGLAASSVVIFHAGHFAAVAAGKPSDDIVKIALGALGVMMFFIISGFVITLNRHLPPAEFVSRRALRIYPAFWSAYALSAAIVAVAGLSTNFSWRALFLLPTRDTLEIHLPIWTLIFEVFFYAAATALFALRLSDRALTAIALCWVIVVQNMYPYVPEGCSQCCRVHSFRSRPTTSFSRSACSFRSTSRGSPRSRSQRC